MKVCSVRHRRRVQVGVGFAVGSAAALVTFVLLKVGGSALYANDFTYPWVGARAILSGGDPYTAISTAAVPWRRIMLYPAPALLIALLFAWMPVKVAGALFVGVGSGFLAALLSNGGAWRLALFVSAPMLQACASAQWSPLLVACALYAPALGILTAKPNLAIPLIAMQRSTRAIRYAVIGGVALIGAALIVVPHWPEEWVAAVHGSGAPARYVIPIRSAYGVPLLLAGLRWRRPEGRLLLFMACVPQNVLFYDQLALLLIPLSRREMTLAVAASLIAYIYALQFPWLGVPANVATANILPAVIVGLYWPSLAMVLRRANEGVVPAWLERRLAFAPPWLRGVPAAS